MIKNHIIEYKAGERIVRQKTKNEEKMAEALNTFEPLL